MWRNSLLTLLSLAMFRALLFVQYDRFDEGRSLAPHECPCQKQPWTKITLCNRRKTKSG